MIPLSVPSINGNAWKYVKECLDTDWVSSAGKYVDLFEQEIREYTGAKYAIACVNGTAALHTSLIIAGVLPGDEVIVPSLTFISPVNTIRYCDAHPVFMDSDDYYNIDVEKTIDFIENETKIVDGYTVNKKTNNKITAIIPVHVFGNAVYLDELFDICKARNIKIIEDATESLGTKYIDGKFKEKHTGTVGDLGCLSFNGNKIITTGGGGMILTDNESYALKAKYLTTQAKDDTIRYIHNDIGYNYRLTNLQAALGVAQIEQLPQFIETKKKNYEIYRKEIEKIEGVELAETPKYADNNLWLYALLVSKKVYGKDIHELLNTFAENKVQTRPVWYPNHLQAKYRDFQSYKIENALRLWEKTLNIPSSVTLNEDEIKKVVGVL